MEQERKQKVEETDSGSKAPPFPMVAVGASAGGLKAFEQLFTHLPFEPGMAFILVQHLDPHHQSELAEIVQNYTAMSVTQVEQHMGVEANNVYVIPPGKSLTIKNRVLHLSEPLEPRGRRNLIDQFFRSLASDQRENAVCIVLSGTGSDGTLGLKSIKENGGVVMAQDPNEAEYDGMPRSAIATGFVDVVAPASQLASKLVNYHQSTNRIQLSNVAELDEDGALQRIYAQLETQSGHDFSNYKRATILRRIQRRMQVHQIDNLNDYLEELRANHQESVALFRDFLISVTNFFRDREAFERIEKDVIPKLFDEENIRHEIRVWVPGCATGEEAYSIGMLLLEYASRNHKQAQLQIFATDIDDEALAFARVGVYPATIEADVSAERLQRFFKQSGNSYQVSRELQEIILFAKHNLIKDAPFARLNFISCRNLLIYLNRNVQRQIFNIFHYALKPNGYLFLGSSESGTVVDGYFSQVYKRERIYQRVAKKTDLPLLPVAPRRVEKSHYTTPSGTHKPTPLHIGDLHRDLMLQRYAPPSVIVNNEYEIRYKFGNVGRFLRHIEGEPSLNILDNVDSNLRVELRTTLFRVFQYREASQPYDLHLSTEDGRQIEVRLRVEPIILDAGESPSDQESLALVIFEDLPISSPAGVEEQQAQGSEDGSTVAQLETELQQIRHRLHNYAEEYETSTEELKASNEELQSLNEELRSTSEELETSNEELRATNEELTSVNQELKNRIDEVSRAYSDIENLLQATNIATLFLGRDMRLRRYTPKATELFNIISSDLGRPFAHISHKIIHDGLPELAERVLRTLETFEDEMQTKDGKWIMLSMRPYRTLEDRIDGVVITLIDITDLVVAEQLSERRALQQSIVAELGQMALRGIKLESLMEAAVQRVAKTLNVELTKILQLQPDGHSLLLKAGVGWREGLIGSATVGTDRNSQAGYTLRSDEPIIVSDLSTEERFRGPALLTEHKVVSGISVIIHGQDGPYGVFGAHSTQKHNFTQEDTDFLQGVANVLGTAVTRQQADEERAGLLAQTQAERKLLSTVLRQIPLGVIIVEAKTNRLLLNNQAAEEIWDTAYRADGPPDYSITQLFNFDRSLVDPAKWPLTRAIEQGETVQNEEFIYHNSRSKSDRFVMMSAAPVRDQGGKIVAGVAVFQDVTQAKETEIRLQQYRDMLALSYDAILVWQLNSGILFWNRGAEDLYGYSAAEAIGQMPAELLHHNHPWQIEEIRKALEASGEWEGELLHTTKDGRIVSVSSRHQLLEVSGKDHLVLVINRDITPRKTVERERERLLQELQVLTSTLEDRVEQRTAQIRVLASDLTMAEQRERERISAVLHDDLQQMLHALQVRMLILSKQPNVIQNPTMQSQLQELEALSNQALSVTRSLTVELSPPVLESEGLVQAFQWLVHHMQEMHGLTVELHVTHPITLPHADLQEIAFQMVRELLFNVVKHADLQQARLDMWQEEEWCVVQVSDKGKGFDPSLLDISKSSGFGLRSIQQRIELFGSQMRIESHPGKGTTITLRLPTKEPSNY